MTDLVRIKPKTEYGNADVAYAGEILRTTVGSELHGIGIAGTDDHDEMGIYIEPEKAVLGLAEYWSGGDHTKRVDSLLPDRRGDYTARTAAEGERSYHGDTDLTLYTLKKYLRLAIVGNPTALLPLYAPDEFVVYNTYLGEQLRNIRSSFLSQLAIHRFLGYLEAQHERMLGSGSQNRVPKRPELTEKYGYDTKYASHAYRLGLQGLEIANFGTLTLPLPEGQRELVLSVKRGEVKLDEVSQRITNIRRRIQNMLDADMTAVPERPDVAKIEYWMINAQKSFWQFGKGKP